MANKCCLYQLSISNNQDGDVENDFELALNLPVEISDFVILEFGVNILIVYYVGTVLKKIKVVTWKSRF